jgi:acid phosphatase
MRAQLVGLLAAASTALAQTQYTKTSTADVYAAQATAKTLSPTSNVKGKAFDRLAIVWLENTDYELAIGDR